MGHRGTDTWGRYDTVSADEVDTGWIAFTTDPGRHELGWVVRFHPEYGRSVILYRDEDVSSVHTEFTSQPGALLYRSGGHWWDGQSWYRPAQLWDGAKEEYVRRVVPAATTISAADLLPATGTKSAAVLAVEDVKLESVLKGPWGEHLAAWAHHRGDLVSLQQCVVQVTAPELSGDQLVGVVEMAEIAGIAPATLRAYISRDEGDVPQQQATVHKRSVWSRAVAQEWAEMRRHSPDAAAEALSSNAAVVQNSEVPTGVGEIWERFAGLFFSRLWENPERRKRWALRWRTQAAVRDVSRDLGWVVASGVNTIVPIQDLGATIRHAVLDEIAEGKKLNTSLGDTEDTSLFYGIAPSVARMLGWLIRHNPTAGAHTITEIIGDADRNHGVPRVVAERTIRTALGLDGKLGAGLQDYLDAAFGPQ